MLSSFLPITDDSVVFLTVARVTKVGLSDTLLISATSLYSIIYLPEYKHPLADLGTIEYLLAFQNEKVPVIP